MELSPKARKFVTEYLKDFNGTQAAIRAGYSSTGAGVTANRLLKNPKIHDMVARVEDHDEKLKKKIISRLEGIVDMAPDPETLTFGDQVRAAMGIARVKGWGQEGGIGIGGTAFQINIHLGGQ